MSSEQRVKYMTIGRFKVRVKAAKRNEFGAFKHFDEIWQVEEEAFLVPYDMWIRIQVALVELETRQ